MAVAVGLAVLVVGVGYLVRAVLALFRRDWERGSVAGRGEPASAEVVVVIPARGYGPGIVDAVDAAAALVPRGDIVVVADQDTLDHVTGVNTLVTDGTPTEAVRAAATEFRLAERYASALVLHPDHRPHRRYLDRTLPLLSDPAVAAVAGYARTEWATARPTPLTAYRERALVLAQWPLTFARTRPGVELTRTLPSPARLYRADLLAHADDHTTPALHAAGRVIVVRGALVDTRDPDRIGAYVRQLRRWTAGSRQVRTPAVVAHVVEQVVTALVLLAAPVLAATGVLPWQAVLIGLLVPDYLLTLLVALLRRDHRFLLPGLVFPLLRLVDAVATLLPARPGQLLPIRSAHDPRPAAGRPWWRARPVVAIGWAAAVAAGAALVWRVAGLAASLPVSPAEPALVDAAYGRVAGLVPGAVPGPLAALTVQLITHAGLTGSFTRHADLLTGARELSAVACAVVVACLVLTAVALRLRPIAVVAALGALALAGPVAVALAPLSAGAVAAAWLAVAALAAAYLDRSRKPLTVVVLAAAGAIGTAPALALPVTAGVAAWAVGADLPVRRKVVAVVVPLLLGGAAHAAFAATGLLAVPTAAAPRTLVEACVIACAAGLLTRRSRPVAAGALLALLLDADVLLPAALAATALVTAVLVDEATRAIPAGAAFLAQRAAVVTATAAVLVLAATAAGAAVPTAPRADHRAVADWFTATAPPGVELSAPPLLWSDLRRDLGGDRVRRDGAPLAVSTGDGPGPVVAAFDGVTVRLMGTADGYLSDGDRAAAGTQLAANPRLTAPDSVLSALRSGGVDLRAMAVLAQLTGSAPITVAATANPQSETGSPLPHRTVVVSEVDGQPATEGDVADTLRDWLAGQRAPYAPDDVVGTPAGLALTWRLPALSREP